MVLLVGLVLNSNPFAKSNISVASTLSSLQSKIMLLGYVAVWLVLLSKVANSWGTKATLPILYAAGVPSDWAATQWQEFVVLVAHYRGSPVVVAPALFQGPEDTTARKQE
ncbi:hypothetical protein G7Y89_g3985 [Cudoniella acicularis]|uniref:Uncharacterized protein n=1 Tax=Cudoniella acicularis TaxID=354080 RepID=A0A8H4RTB4_9HELO|nr:hypothetical protein G7Y89_g3985 [Cudoniella acicularis]